MVGTLVGAIAGVVRLEPDGAHIHAPGIRVDRTIVLLAEFLPCNSSRRVHWDICAGPSVRH